MILISADQNIVDGDMLLRGCRVKGVVSYGDATER